MVQSQEVVPSRAPIRTRSLGRGGDRTRAGVLLLEKQGKKEEEGMEGEGKGEEGPEEIGKEAAGGK